IMARPPEPPTCSDDSDISDVPRSALGRRQNQYLQRDVARPIPQRKERQDSQRQQVASREARKKDWALLEFVEQQSLFSIASTHRLMGAQEADRLSSELFCNTESLTLLSEYLVSTEAEPGLAGFLWAASNILDHELHSGASRNCLTMRNAAIVVQQNFRRLQAGDLANETLSFLIVQDAGTSTTKNVSLLTFYAGCSLLDGDQEPEVVVEGIRVCVEELILKCKFEFPSLQIKYPRWSADFAPTVFRESNDARSFGMSAPLEIFLKSVLESVRTIIEIIDFVVLTFAKGHFGPFDAEPLASTGGVFFFHGPPSDVGVLVHRLPLRCLSKMLGGQHLWVFEQATTPSNCEPLYLRTTMETFANVWGPIWTIHSTEEPDSIERYAVGGGSVLPLKSFLDVDHLLRTGDRLCHWLSRDETLPTCAASAQDAGKSSTCVFDLLFSQKLAGSGLDVHESHHSQWYDFIDSEKLQLSDTLVIGAGSEPGLRWRRCSCPIEAFKKQLKGCGRMDHIIADSAYRFINARQIGVVAGSHGLTIRANVIYKDKKETPLKQSLLDRWEFEPHTQDPRELGSFWGLAVSLCTMNARRVRVTDLLGLESVIGLLTAFTWSDEAWDPVEAKPRSKIRDRYIEAVHSADPYALADMWEQNPAWRAELGSVLLVCLKILSKTGFDPNHDEFHILWKQAHFRGPRRVILKVKDQSWIRFLHDSTHSMTMAVIVEDSLGQSSVCGNDRPQWFKHPSLLETSICVNTELEVFRRLRTKPASLDPYQWFWGDHCSLWPRIWDISRMKEGDLIWTSAKTRLKIIRCVDKWGLLLEWDRVMRDKIRLVIGLKPAERVSHWEYTNEDEEDWEVRPIPVHIIS
ncbi:MAG: hypothetical protein Q9215_007159, partial [Flavoplaca cf. flavocitrina]